jgi:Transcriptional regulator, AbiEi antitoxin
MRGEMRSHTALADLAERRFGVVSFRQLRELGFSKGAIARMSEADRLRRIHRGVYAVGRARLSQRGRCMAGLLACGNGAVVSHGSAAWLWGLQGTFPRPVEVSIPGNGHRRRGVWTHRVTSLNRDEQTLVDDVIPVTSLPRTFLDIAVTTATRRVESMLERAERRGLLDLDAIDVLLRRHQGVPGTARLRDATEIYRDPAFYRARSERLFKALIKKAGLPPPAMNIFIAGHEIDAYWEAERFAVEVDGWGTHRTRAAFERDPLRQEDLLLAGTTCIRITARRIEREPNAVAARLIQHLAKRRNGPTP